MRKRITENMLKTIVFFFIMAWSPLIYGTEGSDHKKAVEIARKGQFNQALSKIDAIAREKGWYESLVYDYIAILTWQGNYPKADTIFREKVKKAPEDLPSYVLECLARVCREIKQYQRAQLFYTLLLKRNPKDIDAHIGVAMVFLAQDNPYEVPVLLAPFKNDPVKGIEALKVMANAYIAIGFYSDALDCYIRILDKKPTDKEAIQGKAKALNELVASYEAENIKRLSSGIQEYSDETIKILGKDLYQKIKSNQAALDIKWGIASDYPENYGHFDHAIEKLTRHISEETDQGKILSSTFDLIVAYNRRNRHDDVIRLYEDLLSQGKTNNAIPIDAMACVGWSYVYKRQLKEAKEIFSFILEKNPNHIEAIAGMYYALLENEDLYDSLDFARKHRPSHKKFITIADVSTPNENRETLEGLYYVSFLYASLLSTSEEELRDIIKTVPYNVEFRRILGETYLVRGLPRAALKEFDIGQTNDPENVGLKVSRIGALMTLAQYDEAEKLLNTLKAKYPDNEVLKRVEKEWEAYQSMELNTRYEFEKGGIASSGTSLFEASLYSRPIHYNFRAFLTSRYLTGNFQEGSLYYVLGGVGGEYKSTNFMTILEVNRSHYKGKSKMGSKMTVNVTPSDEWSFSGRADVNSIETPGRALANDISSHYFQAGINYAYNNALNLGVGLFDQEFTGNNAWHGANTYIQGQIIEKPRYTLDLRLDLGYRKSKTNDVPYYSPLRDSYVSLSPIFDQILYRNYEFSFRHKITPNVGRYFERGFKDSTTFGVSYEQTISHQNWYSLGYGFGRKRSTYDGVPEYATTLFVNFNIRL